jgi:hypothetical protein
MKLRTSATSLGNWSRHGPVACPRDGVVRRRGAGLTAAGLIVGLITLAGCEPPTEVIDLRDMPAGTRDAMLQMRVLPLGTALPEGVGSIGAIAGYGCGQTSDAASLAAVQQLQVKALRMHATAVADVLIRPAGIGPCMFPYSALAKGIAVAPRGIPSSY